MNESKITSLVPKKARRAIEISRVISKLSWRISDERHEHDLRYSLDKFFNKHKIAEEPELRDSIFEQVREHISADQVYDSERNQAYRALSTVLMAELPTTPMAGYPVYQSIEVTGWIAGEVVIVNHRRYELTGDACPECKVNPKAYGIGGGVRCVDEVNCRWWYCA